MAATSLSRGRSLFILAGLTSSLAGLQASPWIGQDRWMVLGPLESIGDCSAADLESNPTPGHDLEKECPLPGDDWGDALGLVPGAPREWTELAALGIGQGTTVDLGSYAFILGLNSSSLKAVAVTYAMNRTSSPIDVDVCWSSASAAEVWVNDRTVAKVSFSGLTNCDCTGRQPATLVPGANKIALALFETCQTSWDFRLRLLRPDGQAIDDSADPEVEFSAYPDGGCPPSSPFQATRSIESVNACPALPGGTTITIRGNCQGDPEEPLTLIETINGQGVPSSVSAGGVITALENPPACTLEPKAPVGQFTDHRDIGSPCGPGSTVEKGPGAYEVTGGGHDQFSCGDSFQFAFVSLSGDFSITVHTAERDWGAPNPSSRWGKFGLMARQTCSQKSRFAFIHDSSPNPFPGGTEADPDGIAFDGRPFHEGDDVFTTDGQVTSGLKHPDYLRLERNGNTFRGFASTDGEDWRKISEMDWGPGAPCEALAGLAVLSNADCGLIRIRFDQVAVSGGDHPCPPPGAGGARITWNLRGSDLSAGVSYRLAGSGTVQLSGNDGRHATEGGNQVLLEANNPVGPDFEDSRTIGRPFRGTGSTTYEGTRGVYTQTGSGYDLWDQGDGFQFAYRRISGDFDLSVEVVERDFATNPGNEWGKYGLLAARGCHSNSKHTFVEENVGSVVDSPRLQTRVVDGIDRSDTEEFFGYPDPDRDGPETGELPDFLKVVRHGSTFYGFLSRDGVQWDSIGGDTWYGQNPEDPILAGFATMWHTTMDRAPVMKFKVLQFGPLEPALPPPFHDGETPAGTEIYRTGFEDLADFQVQRGGGVFDPKIAGGRLRLQDQTELGSSTSAFRKTPIEDIDSAIYQFDFDAFISRDPGELPADGLTFTVNGGRDATRVGLLGGWMGYEGLGGGNRFDQIVADQNVSKNSFSVEFDTWQGNPMLNDGIGSPDHPRSWHLGINTANTINSVVQTSEGVPDIFDPQGIHARIRYNRGRVTVSLAPRAGSTEGLKQYLEADLIPLSFLAADESAVFGFTAATGGAAETGEVDNLVVTRFAPGAGGNWLRCDPNGDRERDISDPIFLLQSLFGGGAAAECPAAADCNSDGAADISDAVFDLAFQFLGGPGPAAPYPACDAFPGCPDRCR